MPIAVAEPRARRDHVVTALVLLDLGIGAIVALQSLAIRLQVHPRQLLAALYAGLILVLEGLVGLIGNADAQRPLVLVISTLAIAALFQPLRVRLQRGIDRRFFRAKYDTARTLAAFGAALRQDVDLAELRAHLVGVVEETMKPTHVSLWLRRPGPDR